MIKYWWNDYVGVPYKLHGRDKSGVDCWGLVRLVYKEQKLVDLPSFVDTYTSTDPEFVAELIARNSEGWDQVQEYTEGDVVLFRTAGHAAHVGVIISENEFIHAREGSAVSIEKLNSPAWRRRIVGVYRYAPNVTINAVPSALKTTRLTLKVSAGKTIKQVIDEVYKEGLKSGPVNHLVFLDGVPVDKTKWESTVLKAGSSLDYRAVPEGDVGRLLVTLAVVYFAVTVAGPWLASAQFGAGGALTSASFMGLTGQAALTAATMAVNLVGGLLVNAIFPIRPPEQAGAVGGGSQFKNTNVLQGGQNSPNPYGAIPVVLGRIRYTPPVGAVTYSENSGAVSYLRMLTVWGYGPLQVSGIELGNVDLGSYDEAEEQTLFGDDTDTAETKAAFDSIYGKDVQQITPNITLEAETQYLTKVSVESNVLTCTVNGQGKDKTHNLAIDDPIQRISITGGPTFSNLKVTTIISDTVFKCTPTSGTINNVTYGNGSATIGSFFGGNPSSEHQFSQDATKLGITLMFPQGLYGISDQAKDRSRSIAVSIKYRQVGETTWKEVGLDIGASAFSLSGAFFNLDNDAELEPVYQWTYITTDTVGNLIKRTGGISNNKYSNASGTLVSRSQVTYSDEYGGSSTYSTLTARLPTVPSTEKIVWVYCVYGDKIVEVQDKRVEASVTGCSSSISAGNNINAARSFTISAGKNTSLNYSVYLNDVIKYGYAHNVNISVASGKYEVSVQRVTSNTHLTETTMDTCVLNSLTAYSNTRPVIPPKDSYGNEVKLCMTALRIRASGQLNNVVDGISAVVQTIGEDYVSGAWVAGRPIRNPAALFRHVLKHQGNARANTISIDDAAIAGWYTYCKSNSFNFDKVYLEATSLLEVLKDIAAAGRASPTMVDGKWTVIIDRPRTYVAQHFTPHNSWGFEGVRSFPTVPHAFRVNFNNATKDFAPDERIVYNDGYTASNATLFETIELPGVTDPNIIHKHARFHLAQIKLRPETYTLNVDVEHLICTRGDLVKVVHDVPMWGLGSARINSITAFIAGTSGTKLTLSEALPMDAGVEYSVRIRRQDASSIVYKVKPSTVDGYYSTVELVTGSSGNYAPYDAGSDSLNADDLVLYGTMASESVDLIVQSIEPSSNMTARLTLVDYSPAVYNSDNETIPAFNSKITIPPSLISQNITYTPTIDSTHIVSDHTVMEKAGPSTFICKMKVPINSLALSASALQKITHIEGQIKLSSGTVWQNTQTNTLANKFILFSSVTEDETYDIRVRYTASTGKTSAWSTVVSHTVVGKKAPPSNVTGVSVVPVALTGKLAFSWNAIPDIDVTGYEVRTDTNWGSVTNRIFLGSATTCSADPGTLLSPITYYIKAIDANRNYSLQAGTASYTVVRPVTYSGTVTHAFADTSTTASTVTVSWTPKSQTGFQINKYELTIVRPNSVETVHVVSDTSFTTQANWTGTATIQLKCIDILDNKSAAAFSYSINKTPPNAPTQVTFTVTGQSVLMDWPDVAKTTLPVGGYEVRKTNTSWGVTNSDLLWRGSASSYTTRNISIGTNTYYVNTFDTDSVYGVSGTSATFTAAGPSIPLSLSGAFNTDLTNATAQFTWAAPSTSVFGVARYLVSLVTESPARTVTSTRDTTDWTVAADWVGSGVLTVIAEDTNGLRSTPASYTLTKSVPNQPLAVSSTTVVGTSIQVDWPDNIRTSLPVVGYEIRDIDSNWGATGFTWKGNSSNTTLSISGTAVGGTKQWYLRAYDSSGQYSSSSRSFSYTVSAPVNTSQVSYQFEDTNLTSASMLLSWSSTSPTFGLKHYQVLGTLQVLATTTANSSLVTVSSTKGVSVGDSITSASIPAGRTISQILNSTQVYLNNGAGVTAASQTPASVVSSRFSNSTTLSLPADWLGDKVFTVKTVDNLDNYSSGVSVTATKSKPAVASNFRAQVIDNTVLLYWDLPSITTLPISHVRIKKGTNWQTAELIGDKSGTFTTLTELRGGTYTYWVAVVDTGNNESDPIELSATVSAPPDYIFNAEWQSDFTGTKSNAVMEENTGHLVLPVNTSEQFAGHFTNNAWASPSAQVSAGYPVYVQPGTSSGYYEEVFDYGATLGASQISIAASGEIVAGAVGTSITISTSLDGTTYPNVYTNAIGAFATNFRYVKVRFTATQSVTGGIYKLTALTVRLDAKQKTDSGTEVLVLGGAHAQGNVGVDYLDTWTPNMAMPPAGFTLNGAASENAVFARTGPGGISESVWVCIDSDTASDMDGGWLSVYKTVDNTKGHLFAVFVKTSTANGTTYWGTNQNSTLSSISGIVQTNPYFWSGDLPALNTWYLVVGYVYPLGYSGADDGISGVYSLSGSKTLSGASFKFNSGTALMHRAYHYYNSANSGAEVQYMARPVILECDSIAEATEKVQYLLRCATQYGVSVKPSNSFFDITSITATPSGTSPTTPIVDFDDVPYPTRFNIFNYNQSGSLVGGNVAWTVRGY